MHRRAQREARNRSCLSKTQSRDIPVPKNYTIVSRGSVCSFRLERDPRQRPIGSPDRNKINYPAMGKGKQSAAERRAWQKVSRPRLIYQNRITVRGYFSPGRACAYEYNIHLVVRPCVSPASNPAILRVFLETRATSRWLISDAGSRRMGA